MAKNSIPMDFDTGNDAGADANMDGRTPIAAGPDVPARPATDQNFNAQVEREVTQRVQVRENEHAAAVEAATAEGQRTAALATLGAMIEGNPGDTRGGQLKFRGKPSRTWCSPFTAGPTSRPRSTSPRRCA